MSDPSAQTHTNAGFPNRGEHMSDEVKRPTWPAYPHTVTPAREEAKYLHGFACELLHYADHLEAERDIYADAAFRWWYQARQNNYAAWAHLRRAEEWKARCMTSEASEEDAQKAAAKFKRRAEAAEQRATEAELQALNMADDRPIQVSAANAETNDDLRNENKQLREALNYATQDMDHEDIAIVEQIAHGLWRWYDGAVSDDLRRENARLREAIGLPAVVFNAMKRWVADKSWDSTVLESIEIRYAGHTFYPLTQDEITERGAKPGQQIWPPVVDSANDSREAKTETCRWYQDPRQTWEWGAGCGQIEEAPEYDIDHPRTWQYCPYCGKPIEIVSEEVEG